nr:MAG TPA: hypothetical protein [Caudoviricetes sp.]
MNIAEVYDQFKKYDVFKASLGELTVLETFPNGEVDALIGEKQFHFYSEAVLSLVKLFDASQTFWSKQSVTVRDFLLKTWFEENREKVVFLNTDGAGNILDSYPRESPAPVYGVLKTLAAKLPQTLDFDRVIIQPSTLYLHSKDFTLSMSPKIKGGVLKLAVGSPSSEVYTFLKKDSEVLLSQLSDLLDSIDFEAQKLFYDKIQFEEVAEVLSSKLAPDLLDKLLTSLRGIKELDSHDLLTQILEPKLAMNSLLKLNLTIEEIYGEICFRETFTEETL